MMEKARVLKAACLSLGAKQSDPSSESLLERVYDENVSCFCPRSLFAAFPVLFSSEGVCLEGTDVCLTGDSIKKHLDGASFALLNAFTLGALADKRIKELSYSRPSESVALNAIASVYAELAADEELQKERDAFAAKGLRTNFRFCPGYGDLSLLFNESVARALNAAKKIGLSVTEGGLLLPRKSVVGIVGVFEKKADAGE